jgi:hypothetical protein
VIKPSPNLLVVEVPEMPGMTTGTLRSLSLPQTVAGEESQIAKQRQITGRNVFMHAFYPMGQVMEKNSGSAESDPALRWRSASQICNL